MKECVKLGNYFKIGIVSKKYSIIASVLETPKIGEVTEVKVIKSFIVNTRINYVYFKLKIYHFIHRDGSKVFEYRRNLFSRM